MTATPLLVISGLKVHFALPRKGLTDPQRYVYAVDGVDLAVDKGKTLGLVGESGSGKTTVGRAVLRLVEATAGTVVFDGHEVFALDERRMRELRPRMQIVFQDPQSSLDPRMTVMDIVTESQFGLKGVSRAARRARAGELLERVGLSASYMSRYPHEFSGGQRQRIGIARALASKPDFIVCDEPVSALDVSIQAQILNLLADLQDELGLSYLFIAHNLAVVEHFAHEIAVMYLGRIVERAPREVLYGNPLHPYTASLLASVPAATPALRAERTPLEGETPSPVTPPRGCHFHPRCPVAHDDCRVNTPELRQMEPGHLVRCPYAGR